MTVARSADRSFVARYLSFPWQFFPRKPNETSGILSCLEIIGSLLKLSMATLNNLVIGLLRHAGATNIAQARCACDANITASITRLTAHLPT